MPKAAKSAICLRKEPQQDRSRHLVEAILEAAIRILKAGGSFTMAEIAGKAGVSVGSLYQYFPNKQAVLFRLQTAEWDTSYREIERLLNDKSQTPERRLAAMISFFFASEREEAPFRHVLEEASPLYRATPEALAQKKRSRKVMAAFVAEMLPHASPPTRAFAADFVKATVAALGVRLSNEPHSAAEIDAFAAATAAMLNGWLKSLKPRR